jgi:transposase-like protein
MCINGGSLETSRVRLLRGRIGFSITKEARTMGKKCELEGSARRDVVLMFLRREEPAAVLARRYGISEQTLYRWRDEFLAGGESALAGNKGGMDPRDRQVEELKREVSRRDQVIGELTIANRILKKTADGLL